MVKPGEPEFTSEDTAAAIALAEEERDTCPSCGLPKAWCRDPKSQFVGFAVHEETCFVTETLATHRRKVDEGRTDEQRASIQMSARFADGYEPDIEAGLGLEDQEDAD